MSSMNMEVEVGQQVERARCRLEVVRELLEESESRYGSAVADAIISAVSREQKKPQSERTGVWLIAKEYALLRKYWKNCYGKLVVKGQDDFCKTGVIATCDGIGIRIRKGNEVGGFQVGV